VELFRKLELSKCGKLVKIATMENGSKYYTIIKKLLSYIENYT